MLSKFWIPTQKITLPVENSDGNMGGGEHLLSFVCAGVISEAYPW
jgi:hypothetical protein